MENTNLAGKKKCKFIEKKIHTQHLIFNLLFNFSVNKTQYVKNNL